MPRQVGRLDDVLAAESQDHVAAGDAGSGERSRTADRSGALGALCRPLVVTLTTAGPTRWTSHPTALTWRMTRVNERPAAFGCYVTEPRFQHAVLEVRVHLIGSGRERQLH